MIPNGDLFKFGSKLAEFLDSEIPKISLMAMNSMVGICAIWPNLALQEVFREILEEKVYGFLIDRVDAHKGLEQNHDFQGGFLMGNRKVEDLAISKDFKRRQVKELKKENDWVGDILQKMNWNDPDAP